MIQKIKRIVYAIISAAVLTAWLIALLSPHKRPKLLSSVVGCYAGNRPITGGFISISPLGVLVANGVISRIEIYEDKQGLSLLPDKKVVIVYDPSARLVVQAGTPLLMRLTTDRNSFHVLSENGPDVDFVRERCPKSSAQLHS